uniref:Uncharacterized protein n=1 Tax=Anguilla anguilla TaxID=7936 RepID=A0A0E9WZN1_ANGAN
MKSININIYFILSRFSFFPIGPFSPLCRSVIGDFVEWSGSFPCALCIWGILNGHRSLSRYIQYNVDIYMLPGMCTTLLLEATLSFLLLQIEMSIYELCL